MFPLIAVCTQYCNKYRVQLVPDKTKLLVFSNTDDIEKVVYPKLISSISLNSKDLEFSEEAEHLGILRSTKPGNMSNIFARVSAYKKQLFSLLPAGLALHHHAHPVSCLRVERLYALPVLLSGLGALVLSNVEDKMIYNCHKNTLSRLMKLHEKTPACAVFFLAGSLPSTAFLHLRQLSLFGMVSNLSGNILNVLARQILIEARPSSRSWFRGVRELCVKYDLPHPLHLLDNPMPPEKFKLLCKQKVLEFWHQKLSDESLLSSLRYLQPRYLSLSDPHPIWTSLDGNPYQAKAAHIQALFLSGRYRTERMCRHRAHFSPLQRAE